MTRRRIGPLPPGVRRVFRLALSGPPADEEVNAEIAFHLEMRAAELAARGLTPEDADAAARRRFGDTDHWSRAMRAIDREYAARRRRTEWFGDLRQDLRYGVRSLARTPLFAVLAVVTLALGIGANAAVFGVVKSVLLDALPYADADRLVRVYAHWANSPSERQSVSPGVAADLAARVRTFTHVAAFNFSTVDVTYADRSGPRVLSAALVGGGFFSTIGVRAALGSSRPAIARLVLREGSIWMAAGVAGGAVDVVLVARLVRGLLYEVAPFDPVALGLAVALLAGCAAVALLVPVRRATRVDPITVLR